MTLSTRQSPSGWLNDEAFQNIPCIFVTLSTRQSFSGWLNDEAHIRDLVDPPVVQRLVERRGAAEHPAHIRDVVDPPVVQRTPVEVFVTLSTRQSFSGWLTSQAWKHHIRDLVDPPVVQRLVERRGVANIPRISVTLSTRQSLMSGG